MPDADGHSTTREELERQLATRLAELAAAHKRIDDLLEIARKWKETKAKLARIRDERDGLRESLEYRFGRKFILPFRKLGKALRKPAAPGFEAPGSKEKNVGPPSYHQWVLAQRPSAEALDAMRREAAQWNAPPLVSIVTPVFNTPLSVLDEAVQSVRAQVYANWELILADDCSPDARIAPELERMAASDSRIKVSRLPQNAGIAAASNAALALARGEFVGLLDHDDWIEPHTLFEIVKELRAAPEADLVYTDEDKVDEAGYFLKPFFKPDWSPDALLSHNYILHFTVIRRTLLETLGGFREGFDGAQDYDLFLRATERARQILHVPKILYHWRISSGSTAANAQQKPEMIDNGERVLADALARRGIKGRIERGTGARYRVRREIAEPKEIAIIIPTKDRVELLARCVESIRSRTDYPNYKIVIVDNDSEQVDTRRFFKSQPATVLRFSGPFNFSALNNFAVRQTTEPWILFLNNDTEVINGDWLTSMAEHIQRPEVGAVGAKLLYPDDTVQHAGVVLSETVAATHAYQHAPAKVFDNGGHLQLTRNYSAITAACMLTRRDVFEQVGGFDEKGLAVAYNDVDYCLRLQQAGYAVVYTPFAQLYHYESASRGQGRSNPAEAKLLRERWPAVLAHDPFYNENLARAEGAYSFR
ncbi:MAG: hypothetical protein QOD99_515 [Chthoniobacter sp.]|jgi:GT2 family glycosyltransferase|nr:hypothetical protein [Chthoniobacter sp.]